jgi:hypothetical protein
LIETIYVKIEDLSGKIIDSQNIKTSHPEMNVQYIENGTYIMKIFNPNTLENLRFISFVKTH